MPAPTAPSPFVTTAWLAEHLHDPGVVVVDGSWYLPTTMRDARAEYRAGHIPGAVFFDIDAIADGASPLPHMLPSAEDFALAAGALGIGDAMRIVVYDGAGLFSAPRVRWTLRAFGAKDVSILEGGLPRWIAEGRAMETGESGRRPEAVFHATTEPGFVAGVPEVEAAIASGDAQVVDARAAGRFAGEAAEPRPGLRAGHIPGSRNLPFDQLVADGCLQRPDVLQRLFTEAGVDPTRPVIATCGSGLTAAIVALAIETTGNRPPRLYDGSWSEWGARSDLPVATGD